jgi:hypothetical protein
MFFFLSSFPVPCTTKGWYISIKNIYLSICRGNLVHAFIIINYLIFILLPHQANLRCWYLYDVISTLESFPLCLLHR